MKLRFLTKALLTLLLTSSAIAQETKAPAKPTQQQVKSPDDDLKDLPAFYQTRIKKFREIMRNQPSRDAKVAKAMEFAGNANSEFQRDAITFLGEVQAVEATNSLVRAAKDENAREFALYALGELNTKEAIPVLIQYLNDPNENVRGNAIYSIEKIVGTEFDYEYEGNNQQGRLQAIERIENWWKRVGAQFKPKKLSQEEQKKADEAWEKYGKKYVTDIHN